MIRKIADRMCNVSYHGSAKDKLRFQDLQSEGIILGKKAKLYNFKSWYKEVMFVFCFCLFQWTPIFWPEFTEKAKRFKKILIPIFLPPHTQVLENMTLFSVQSCKGNNLSWAPCKENKGEGGVTWPSQYGNQIIRSLAIYFSPQKYTFSSLKLTDIILNITKVVVRTLLI